MKINKIVKIQRDYFNSGITKNILLRKKVLYRLKSSIDKYEEDIYCALKKDLGKSKIESYLTEVSIVKEEINLAIKNIEKWSTPKIVPPNIASFPSINKIYKEPLGVVLVLSPWNYPFQLCFVPIISAITAGNCVIVKSSKNCPNVAYVMEKIINCSINFEHIYMLKNGENSYEEILKEKYDYIFFTGSERVGKKVMLSASYNLTPVTLELGGKSPCIVDKTANIALTAKKIVWGKLLNAGQTCVAPDYILVDKKIKHQLILYMKYYIKKMYGKNPIKNQNYPQIINAHHFDRLISLLENQNIVEGGTFDKNTLKISPTIIDNTDYNSMVMKEEIFGPIFPVIEYQNINQVINLLKQKPSPLALYIFTKDKKFSSRIIRNISYGGGCVNDVILHLTNNKLPFGGVGNSGMGNYHGKYGFKTFTHEKSVVYKSNYMDIPLRYQPYSRFKLKMFKKLLG